MLFLIFHLHQKIVKEIQFVFRFQIHKGIENKLPKISRLTLWFLKYGLHIVQEQVRINSK